MTDQKDRNQKDPKSWTSWDLATRISALSISYGLFIAVTTTMDTIGPAAMLSIGGGKTVSTYTFTGYHIGGFFSATGSGLLFKKMGRKIGFIIGAAVQLLGAAVALIGIEEKSVACLLFSSICVGFGQGLGSFIRFGATEIVPSHMRPQAISYVMITGVISAVAGPISGTVLAHVLPKEFLGSFTMYALFSVLNTIILFFIDLTPYSGDLNITRPLEVAPKKGLEYQKSEDRAPNSDVVIVEPSITSSAPAEERSIRAILTSSKFVHAVIISSFAQVCMVVPMMSLSVAMISDYGLTFYMSSLAMICHILSTFLVGPLTAAALSKYGLLPTIILSNVVNFLGFFTFELSKSSFGFVLGMILIGMSWNFGYSAGSLLLTYACYDDEKDTHLNIQAWNDSLIFCITAVVSVFSGIVLHEFGWTGIIIFGLVSTTGQSLHISMCWFKRNKFVPLVRHRKSSISQEQRSATSNDIRMSTSIMSTILSTDASINGIELEPMDDPEWEAQVKANANPMH